MNTSILSAFPATPPPDQMTQPRPEKGTRVAGGTREAKNEQDVRESDSAGDSDKADAFAEMLAAMISVATPAAATTTEATSAGVESTTAAVSDVPRDGAGSPLFTSSFTSSPSAPVATSTATPSTATAVDSADVIKPGQAAQAAPATAPQVDAPVLSDSAAAEIAKLGGVETSDVGADHVVLDELPSAEGSLDVDVSVEMEPELPSVEQVDLPIAEVTEINSAPPSEPRSDLQVPADSTVASESLVTTAPADEPKESAASKVNAATPSADATANAEVPAAQPAAPVETAPVVSRADTQPIEAEAPVVDPLNVSGEAQPFEQPPVESTERPERAVDPSPATRKSASTTSRPSMTSPEMTVAAVPAEADAVPAVELTAGTNLKKDFAREAPAVPTAVDEDVAPPALSSNGEVLGAVAGRPETAGTSAAFMAAGSFTDSAAVSTPAHVSQQVMQALAAYEAELPQGGARSFELLLDPPELGRLLVQMSRTSKGVDVRIAAENETVQSILETRGAELQQNLQLSGFDLAQFSGSSQGGAFSGGDEWVGAPTLQSFVSGGAPASPATTPSTASSAVNVVV